MKQFTEMCRLSGKGCWYSMLDINYVIISGMLLVSAGRKSPIMHLLSLVLCTHVYNNSKKGKGAIPEGFFDDPKLDAKARKVEYKDPMNEEWEKFQKTIQKEDDVSKSCDTHVINCNIVPILHYPSKGTLILVYKSLNFG